MRDGAKVNLTRTEFGIFAKLVKHPDQFVHTDRITTVLWGNDPDGGPEDAPGTIRKHLFNVRRKISPYGMMVYNRRDLGYLFVEDRESFNPAARGCRKEYRFWKGVSS